MAPYAELALTSNGLLAPELDQMIVDRPEDSCFEPAAHVHVRRRRPARRIVIDPDRVLGPDLDLVIEVRAETKDLTRAFAIGRHLDGGEGGILDHDAAPLGWRDQPVRAVVVAPEDGGEELDQRFATDRRAVVIPSAITADSNTEIAADRGTRIEARGKIGFARRGRHGKIVSPETRIPDSVSAAEPIQAEGAALVAEIETLGQRLSLVRERVHRVIFGQESVVDESLVTLLSGGHGLLIGVPGLAKTRLVETLGIVLGLEEKRVQCTPDLMPADIIGSEVLEEGEGGRRSFRFIPGPVFSQLLMADEINRASPRTQSALLQAMQEKRVSVAGHYHALPQPFHVLATQNPLEQEGTYPLPEAQLDRFLLQIDVGYPDLDAEKRMLIATTGADDERPAAALRADELMHAQRLVRRMPVGDSVIEAILKLVRAGRPESSDIDEVKKHVAWGPGPRASQALMLACRARAVLDGRLAPSLDDIVALAPPVLRHRMALNFAARAEGVTIDHVIARLTQPFA